MPPQTALLVLYAATLTQQTDIVHVCSAAAWVGMTVVSVLVWDWVSMTVTVTVAVSAAGTVTVADSVSVLVETVSVTVTVGEGTCTRHEQAERMRSEGKLERSVIEPKSRSLRFLLAAWDDMVR